MLAYTQSWRSTLYPENWTPGIKDTEGRFIHDFSYAGYKYGLEDIPIRNTNIVNVTLPPYNVDNSGQSDVTAKIQSAIDFVGNGGGGIVYLPQGTYMVSLSETSTSALRLMKNNVILRGAGNSKTFIFNTTTSFRTKQVIYITGSGASPWETPVGSTVPLSMDIPASTTTIPVSDLSQFNVNDLVILATDFTPDFLNEINATGIWDSTVKGQRYCRRITQINHANNTISIDIPTRYLIKSRDNARIYKVKTHISECGIEDLSVGNLQNPKIIGVSDKPTEYTVLGTGEYEVHMTSLINVRNAINCWVKNVNSYRPILNTYDIHSLSNGIVLTESKNVSVVNCNFSKPQYRGGSNGYTFQIVSNDCLLKNCIANKARHSFSFTGGAATNGNVVTQCKGIDPTVPFDFHRNLLIANLIDSYISEGDYINAQFSTGGLLTGDVAHGYQATECVIWNTTCIKKSPSVDYLIQSIQLGNGYVIGTSGVNSAVNTTPISGVVDGTNGASYTYNTSPEDFVEGVGIGTSLIPQSLYSDQLLKRKITTGQTITLINDDIKTIQNTSNCMEFEFSEHGKCDKYQLYNLQGQIVENRTISSNDLKLSVLKNQISKGMYIIRFFNGKDIVGSFKILI
jgi:hypothetical protein